MTNPFEQISQQLIRIENKLGEIDILLNRGKYVPPVIPNNRPIRDLDISRRLYGVLHNYPFKDGPKYHSIAINDLQDISLKNIMKCKQFGKKSYNEFLDLIEDLNIKIKD